MVIFHSCVKLPEGKSWNNPCSILLKTCHHNSVLFRLRLHFKAWPTFDEPLENGKQTRTMLYHIENIVKNHGTSSKQMAFIIIHHMNNHIHRRLVVMNKQLAVYIYSNVKKIERMLPGWSFHRIHSRNVQVFNFFYGLGFLEKKIRVTKFIYI